MISNKDIGLEHNEALFTMISRHMSIHITCFSNCDSKKENIYLYQKVHYVYAHSRTKKQQK